MTNDTSVSATYLRSAYGGKRVLVTGHTGFKGSWLVAWLADLGANIRGLALAPPTQPSLFDLLTLERECEHVVQDVIEFDGLERHVAEFDPEVVFHLAAQPLVRKSYAEPLRTFATNIMGTANMLEAVRRHGRQCAVVVVTTDKCYENREWVYGYREDDRLGGRDPYSASKGAAELVVAAYRRSFFGNINSVRLASARAGNVIGGGDWAEDRLVPDLVRGSTARRPVSIRSPSAIRPWQHVVEPLSGYLLLAARMLATASRNELASLTGAWNFGPGLDAVKSVGDLADAFCAKYGHGSWRTETGSDDIHEAAVLRLSIDKAVSTLGWTPRWSFERAVDETALWYRAWDQGADGVELRNIVRRQISAYMAEQ